MPMDRRLYPVDWEAIALKIKDGADWTCENCRERCRRPNENLLAFIHRTSAGVDSAAGLERTQHPRRWMLTVAHLDHCPENCDRTNLKALCVPCHARYDLSQMARKRRLKRERNGQLRIKGV